MQCLYRHGESGRYYLRTIVGKKKIWRSLRTTTWTVANLRLADQLKEIHRVGEGRKSIGRACEVLGIERITHHDLRHLFATVCIESGVDIPTLSRWLGHKDGGALAMRVYGHLRDEHPRETAGKLKFQQEARFFLDNSPRPRGEGMTAADCPFKQ